MKKLFAIVAAMTIGLFGTASVAQEIRGTAIIDGRHVELLSDFTWRFRPIEDGENCQALSSRFSFCRERLGWERVPPPTQVITAMYRANDRVYAMFVAEGLGSNDGMNPDLMREAALQYAATATNTIPSEVPVLATTEDRVGNHSGQTLSYSVDLNGINVIFFNTAIILPNETAQIVTYGIGLNADQVRGFHATTLSAVRVSQ